MENPKCWARGLGDCAREMSKDHPVSAQLLPHGAVVTGFPWLKGEARAVGLNSLGIRCLCRKHNSDLSPVDDVAGKLSVALDEFIRVGMFRGSRSASSKRWSPHTLHVSGVKLERWCAKFMCTTLAGGLYRDQLPNWAPPLPLVQFAFAKAPLPAAAGLFLYGDPGETRTNEDVFGISPIGDPANILGVRVLFKSLRFCFFPFVDREKAPQRHVEGENRVDVMHHPIQIEWGGANVSLVFDW